MVMEQDYWKDVWNKRLRGIKANVRQTGKVSSIESGDDAKEANQ